MSAVKTQLNVTGNAQFDEKRRAAFETFLELPDDQSDILDIPEVPGWAGTRRGFLYRPVKQQITLRLDAGLIAWFKARAEGGRGYQTDINRALRRHVERCEREMTT